MPCLLNAVNAALQLASGDDEGSITETMVFTLDSHPQVEVRVLPERKGGTTTMPWKYAVWALDATIDSMIRTKSFESSIFYIRYRGRGVGSLFYALATPETSGPGSSDVFRQTMQSLTQSNSINELQSLSVKNTSTVQRVGAPIADAENHTLNVGVATTDATKNDPELRVIFQLSGSVLPLNDVFFSAFHVLRALAPYKVTARLVSDSIHITNSILRLSIRDANNPPRTASNPPYFQAEWLMRAMAQMPTYMLQQGSFREVSMDISVDEIKVAEVSLSRRRPRRHVATS